MNSNFYTPVLLSQDLKMDKPQRVILEGLPVVLVRAKNQINAFIDFCPHRGLALSEGDIIDGQLRCRYHGWKFDCKDGQNTSIPVANKAINCRLKTVEVKDAYDMIWLSHTKDAQLPDLEKRLADFKFSGSIKAQEVNILENFLEGSHTHYIHNGLIRTQEKKRTQLKAKITNTTTGFIVRYDSEPAKGLVTKLLPKRYQHLTPVSQYIHPNIAILEYFDAHNNSIARFEALLQKQEEKTVYLARVFINIGFLSKPMLPFAKKMFNKIILQDKEVLEQQEWNLAHFDKYTFVSDDTDTVGKYIYAWNQGQEATLAKERIFNVYW